MAKGVTGVFCLVLLVKWQKDCHFRSVPFRSFPFLFASFRIIPTCHLPSTLMMIKCDEMPSFRRGFNTFCRAVIYLLFIFFFFSYLFLFPLLFDYEIEVVAMAVKWAGKWSLTFHRFICQTTEKLMIKEVTRLLQTNQIWY